MPELLLRREAGLCEKPWPSPSLSLLVPSMDMPRGREGAAGAVEAAGMSYPLPSEVTVARELLLGRRLRCSSLCSTRSPKVAAAPGLLGRGMLPFTLPPTLPSTLPLTMP